MAESGLTLGFSDFKQAVGALLDHGSTIADWSAAEAAEIERIVQSGIRRVHYPPLIPGMSPHEWSWLRPSTTLTLVVDQWNYTSGTDQATELPDVFGRMIGEFHYALDIHRPPVIEVPLGSILDMRSSFDKTGYPDYFAFRYKSSDGSSGQRNEVLFYPAPDVAYVLSYEYEAYGYILSDTYPYPLGGSQLSELFKESCLAVAELEVLDEGNGNHAKQYQLLLVDAILRDKRRRGKNYGQMGDKDAQLVEWRRGYEGSNYPITYKGSDL